MNDDVLFDCFNLEKEEKAEAKARFGDKAVSLNETLGRNVSFDEVAAAFTDGFRDAFDLTFEPLVFTESQQEEIRQLVLKYESDEWIWKR